MIMSSRRHHVRGAGRIVGPANGTGMVDRIFRHGVVTSEAASKADRHTGSRIVAILLRPCTIVTAPGLFYAGFPQVWRTGEITRL